MNHDEGMPAAQQAIAEGMAFALGMWFVPVPVVGSAMCNAAETKMVHSVLSALGASDDAQSVDALFWFFRKKYFIVNLVTFVPWVGPTVQVLEAYALGQFVIACVRRGVFAEEQME